MDLNPEQILDPELMDSIDEQNYQEAQKNYEEELKAAQARAEQERRNQEAQEKHDNKKDDKKSSDKDKKKEQNKDKKS